MPERAAGDCTRGIYRGECLRRRKVIRRYLGPSRRLSRRTSSVRSTATARASFSCTVHPAPTPSPAPTVYSYVISALVSFEFRYNEPLSSLTRTPCVSFIAMGVQPGYVLLFLLLLLLLLLLFLPPSSLLFHASSVPIIVPIVVIITRGRSGPPTSHKASLQTHIGRGAASPAGRTCCRQRRDSSSATHHR